MNIILTTDVFPPDCGGSGWSTYSLAKSLIKAGHDVEVLSYQRGFTGVGRDEYGGVPVTRVGRNIQADAVSRLLEKKRSSLKFESQIKSVLNEKRIDLIHAAHHLSAAATYNVLRKKEIPFVITVRDYWAICLYSTMVYDNKSCAGCNEEKLKRCFIEYNKKYGSLRTIILPAIKKEMKRRRELLESADRVVFVSRHVESIIRKNIENINSTVIHNGVDLPGIKETLKKKGNYTLEDDYALYIGKIEKYKGSEVLESILKSRKFDLPLVIIGEGNERNKLIETAEKNNKRSVFLNWISNDDVLNIMNNAKFLLFPSIWEEPLSRVLLEAVSTGLPVVAYKSGGTPEIIEDDRNGFLVSSKKDFVRKASKLLTDEDRLQRFSRESKKIAAGRFDQQKLTGKWINLYEQTIREKNKTKD